ncbi:thiopeptide-type bacteriocin biosynthesis protein [Paenibacillus sp. KACC 21273]|uniref:thiopeptide-type bacteriocin biosynthesis protein n=1 Tax=Paenibacillus sp. KACC 21273 TaxID=3025665 RepID=UPI002366F464|nr:thiopeptide-type bacteriocin biosynthesis protein [Paenibacillus sp. KACC 21273]WDF49014.1 thiopeptide-type bacteriocin biosynthesis protein [Paenibacillus sp. KACC 21273]
MTDSYFIRRPVLSFLNLKHLYSLDSKHLEKHVLEIIKDDIYMERILIASPELYKELKKINSAEKNINKNIIEKCLKYLIRMSSRSMPFGLFSGVSPLTFEHSDSNPTSFKKVRVSIEWLNIVTSLIESNTTTSSNIELEINSLTREIEQNLIIDRLVNKQLKRTEIKINKFISVLIKFIEKPKSINEILIHLSDGSDHQKNKILNLLKLLLNHDILVSNIRPESIAIKKDVLESLISKCDEKEVLYFELKEIAELIQKYENTEIGKGISLYNDLVKKMSLICKHKRYIVVDLFLDNKLSVLSKDIGEKVLRDTEFLSFNLYSYQQNWQQYFEKFIEKYGYYNELPLLDLLDPDYGLGKIDFNKHTTKNTMLLERYMLSKIQQANIENKDIIELTEIDKKNFRNMNRDPINFKLKADYDIKFGIVEEQGEQKFILDEQNFSLRKGSFTGRFKSDYEYTCIDQSNQTYIQAELNAVPDNYADIGITYNAPSFQINITSTSQIDPKDRNINVKDLYVGATPSGLYIKSLKLNKEIIPVTTHLLQYINFNENPVLLFLAEFSNYKYSMPRNLTFPSLYTLNYIPRIEYKNIIISPKRWNILWEDMNSYIQNNNCTEMEFLEWFISLYSVDDVVHILDGDKRLPIYVKTELGISFLLVKLKKLSSTKILTLIESPELKSNMQPFIGDYIIQVLTDEKENMIKPYSMGTPYSSQWATQWKSYYIYYKENKRLSTIRICIDYLENDGIKQYFYLDYIDEQKHLRIRYKSSEKDNEVSFDNFLLSLIQDNKIKSFSKHLFLPEYNRYGGKELYSTAYYLFELESKWFFKAIKNDMFKNKTDQEIGIMMCIITILTMHNHFEEGLHFLKTLHTQQQLSLKVFKKNRDYYVNLGIEAIAIFNDCEDLKELGKERANYVQLIKEHHSSDRVHYTLQSLLHMTLNRIIGVQLDLEKEVYDLSEPIFFNLKNLIMDKRRVEDAMV